MVRALIRMGVSANELDHRGRSALHRAVRAGHLGATGVLLKLGAKVDLGACGLFREAPLHLAVRHRFSACVRLLLQVQLLSLCAPLATSCVCTCCYSNTEMPALSLLLFDHCGVRWLVV